MNFKKFLTLFITLSIYLVACETRNQQDDDEGQTMDEVATEGQEITEEQYFDAENYSEYSFVEYAEAKENFGTMVAALKATGLLDSLQQTDEYTLFLPTDAAFDKLGEATVTELMMTDKRDDLRAIIKYHLFPGELHYNDITEGMTVNTMSGNELLFNIQESGMTINGDVKVLDADIETEDGVIHIINQVLIPRGA